MSKLDQDKLKALLKQPGSNPGAHHDCPDDYQLASYMEGGLSERDHIHFESHLADCAYCMERVGSLGRAGESAASNSVQGYADAPAGHLLRLRQVSRWAAAAIVIIAVGFFTFQLKPERGPSTLQEKQNPAAVTERSVEPVSPFPEILFPREGSKVDLRKLVFRWKEVPGSLFYDIRIVSDDGAQIARQRVWDTHWSLPAETHLQTGAEYFVRVDAYVSEGKTVSSEHTVFSVGSD